MLFSALFTQHFYSTICLCYHCYWHIDTSTAAMLPIGSGAILKNDYLFWSLTNRSGRLLFPSNHLLYSGMQAR